MNNATLQVSDFSASGGRLRHVRHLCSTGRLSKRSVPFPSVCVCLCRSCFGVCLGRAEVFVWLHTFLFTDDAFTLPRSSRTSSTCGMLRVIAVNMPYQLGRFRNHVVFASRKKIDIESNRDLNEPKIWWFLRVWRKVQDRLSTVLHLLIDRFIPFSRQIEQFSNEIGQSNLTLRKQPKSFQTK